MTKEKKTPVNRGIYLLPNMFTSAALFAGFYALVAATNGAYSIAAIAIFLGLLADTLDGRVARLIHAQSEFGAQYDSLSDMLTSGIAPALLVYTWSISSLGKLGWLVAFMYTACVALRLARFNTQLGVADKQYFQGLPCPAAAAVLSGIVWFSVNMDVDGHGFMRFLVASWTVMVALLMVSNIRYKSFKEIDFKGRVPFIYVIALLFIFVSIAMYPALVLCLVFVIYAGSGPVLTLYQKSQKRRQRKVKRKIELDD